MAAENCVAQLNEYVMRTRSVLKYEDVGSVGPDHIKTFTIRAVLNGKAYPDGLGKNKKEAKQNAAKNALRGLLEEPADCTENSTEASIAPVHQTDISGINYICWLNEYGQKKRLSIRPVESTRLGPNLATLCCSFVVGDKEYPAGYGKTKREAKEEAAKIVYHEICGSETIEDGGEKYCVTPRQQKEESEQNVSEICDKMKSLNVKAEGESFTKTNFIGIVDHYCQKTKRSRTFIEEKRCGPSHILRFYYKLVIDNKEYPVGEGRSIKEAKQNAAQLAWSALQEQSDWDSKGNLWSAVSDDGSPAKPPSLPRTPETCNAQSKGMKTPMSDPPVPKDQDQSPGVKPKIRLAITFQHAQRNSKEKEDNFNGKSAQKSLSEKTTTQATKPISRFTSEFDSIERLGKGAFGHVFKAKEKLLNKYCAIKIVRCKEKALREVGALSDLLHVNIIRYFTCWMEDTEYQWDGTRDGSSGSQSSSNSSVKYLYIQMELCDTKTLKVWIDEKNTQNVKKSLRESKRREESLTIAQQIVSGVEYIHYKKLIHRDLKPANIMFGQEGEVKIGDFGLVTAEIEGDDENMLERTVYKGTPSYMAPEQKSRSTYDRKVDIFALGLIYFELLWNLSGDRKLIWEDARKKKLPQGFSHSFPEENHIIRSMLRVKPQDRPEASKLKKDLEECTHVLGTLKNMHRDSKTV